MRIIIDNKSICTPTGVYNYVEDFDLSVFPGEVKLIDENLGIYETIIDGELKEFPLDIAIPQSVIDYVETVQSLSEEERVVQGYCPVPVGMIIDNGVLRTINIFDKQKQGIASIDEVIESVKKERDTLLQSTDKFMIMFADGVLTEEQYSAYKSYRQYLRDIPQQETFPFEEVIDFNNWRLI